MIFKTILLGIIRFFSYHVRCHVASAGFFFFWLVYSSDGHHEVTKAMEVLLQMKYKD